MAHYGWPTHRHRPAWRDRRIPPSPQAKLKAQGAGIRRTPPRGHRPQATGRSRRCSRHARHGRPIDGQLRRPHLAAQTRVGFDRLFVPQRRRSRSVPTRRTRRRRAPGMQDTMRLGYLAGAWRWGRLDRWRARPHRPGGQSARHGRGRSAAQPMHLRHCSPSVGSPRRTRPSPSPSRWKAAVTAAAPPGPMAQDLRCVPAGKMPEKEGE